MKKLLLLFTVGLTTAISAQSIPSYVPTDSLVGWWPFNGNANDESGNGNNGTVNGAILTSDRIGNNGSAYDFDGINDAIDIGNSFFNNGWNDYTISLWFKIQATSQTGASQCMLNTIPHDGWAVGYNHSNTQPNRITHAKNANPNFHLWNVIHPNDAVISGPILDTSQWVNVAIIKSDSVYDYFINGVLDTTKYISNNSSIINYWCQLRIGNIAPPYNNEPFNGKIDDIGIWNRALTPAEIQGLYNAQSCTYIDTVLLSVTDTLIIDVNFIGFNPVQFEHSVKAYPNPAKDHLVMDIPSAMITQGYSIDIKNAAGQSVYQSQLNQAQLQIDLTTWGNGGLYFLHLLDSSGSMVDVKKIILQ
jgi:hypothetical protein